jgi:hypothetical protein
VKKGPLFLCPNIGAITGILLSTQRICHITTNPRVKSIEYVLHDWILVFFIYFSVCTQPEVGLKRNDEFRPQVYYYY